MHANGKMILVETVQLWGVGIKEREEGVNSRMIYLIHCKTFSKCCNVSPPITTIKKSYYLKGKKSNGNRKVTWLDFFR
jgi:hypothetical protein